MKGRANGPTFLFKEIVFIFSESIRIQTMKISCTIITIAITLMAAAPSDAQNALHRKYDELPLGSIKPEGWVREMLVRQRDGITAALDRTYPQVMGPDNAWIGGEKDSWERGPYWIDGLLPMAWLLDDDALKAKARMWVEHILDSQRPDGQFGPIEDHPNTPGVQCTKSLDWWPRMVALKILMQYYNATRDERVVSFLTNYFRYQLATLEEFPLGHWSYWGRLRQCDNQIAVLWLYGKTGEKWLLDLAEILHSQGFDFMKMFTQSEDFGKDGSIHCVNLAQGIKEPVVYSQISGDRKYLDATLEAFEKLKVHDGFANGMYGGDEALHGNNPTQGVELCSIVEMMFSLEQMFQISGDCFFADRLEKVAFNALPTQMSDDFKLHQYYQQPNQVNLQKGELNFDCQQDGTGHLFGFLTGYPCCLSNLHQGWPKFAQNLWLATKDGGLAAYVYSPSSVTATLGGKKVTVREVTRYPFEDEIRLEISIEGGRKAKAEFPLELRIPSWSEGACVCVNGLTTNGTIPGRIERISREWQNGDVVTISLPACFKTDRWYENSVSIERGPLVYALRLTENWEKKEFQENEFSYPWKHGTDYWEVTTPDPWNYALLDADVKDQFKETEVIVNREKLDGSDFYWNLEQCPISIEVRGTRVKTWQLYGGQAGPLPFTPWARVGTGNNTPNIKTAPEDVETLTLIPYGCTTLRISEFPLARLQE